MQFNNIFQSMTLVTGACDASRRSRPCAAVPQQAAFGRPRRGELTQRVNTWRRLGGDLGDTFAHGIPIGLLVT